MTYLPCVRSALATLFDWAYHPWSDGTVVTEIAMAATSVALTITIAEALHSAISSVQPDSIYPFLDCVKKRVAQHVSGLVYPDPDCERAVVLVSQQGCDTPIEFPISMDDCSRLLAEIGPKHFSRMMLETLALVAQTP